MADVLIDHDDTGSGPAVCLLHAGVADRRMWAGLRAALPVEFRVLSPDLRGFGRTALPPIGTSYTDAGDVAAVLDAAGVSGATIVGSSMGGRVALELATTRPDLVSSLVLLCAAHRGVAPTTLALALDLEETRLIEAGDLDGAVELNAATWLGPEASDEVHELVRVMQRRAYELQLVEPEHPGPERVDVDPRVLEMPALVVVGERDLDHFVAVGEYLAATLPHARLVRLPWAAHLPALERPRDTAALVSTWLYEMSSA